MRLARLIGSVVLGSGLTTACVTIGEATYVVPMTPGATCENACASASSLGSTEGSWRVGEVLECVGGQYVDAAGLAAARAQSAGPTQGGERADTPMTQVAVCRMRTHYTGGIGRRPRGLVEHAESIGRTFAGAFFARVAHLEAASVPAFERLAAELRTHGAPARLIADASRAAREEARHAAITARWRDHFGGEALPLSVESTNAARTLLEMACENAAEGCVHETWGAVLASVQAARANDPALRRDLARIARDEIGHAELAHRVRRWTRSRLGRAGRARVQAAERGALASLATHLGAADATDVCPEAARTIGLPTAAETRRLFDRARLVLFERLAA